MPGPSSNGLPIDDGMREPGFLSLAIAASPVSSGLAAHLFRSKILDGYADSVQSAPAFVLGVFALRDGKFTMRAEVTGTHPASTGAKYFFGLDCVILDQP